MIVPEIGPGRFTFDQFLVAADGLSRQVATMLPTKWLPRKEPR
jgi:hypothetical protein